MKNLFKNLMLVAVAAMAFTACEKNIAGSEEQKEQNAQGATRITFTADFADDTRSGFDGKVGEAYKSKWHEGDKAKFVANRYGNIEVDCYYDGSAQGWDAAVSSVAESTVSDANIFDVQFDSSLRSNDLIMAFAPAEQWTVAKKLTYCYDSHGCTGWSYPWSGSYSIPEPQTPQATSVDPMAHILKAEADYSSDLATLKFEHQLAYGRMQIKNFTEEIENVKVTIDTKTYTLNATNVKDNLFWFGCEANEGPTTVKVVVNTADKSYTKELDLTKGNGNGLPFIKGQVSKFSVDMEGATADENTGSEAVFKFPEGTHMWDKIEWDSFNSYFKITSSEYSTGTYWRIYLNSNDHENGTNIKPGTYKGYNKTSAPEGYFSTRISIGSVDTPPFGGISSVMYVNDTHELIVDYSNGEYHILMKFEDIYHGFQGTI